jgi:chaperonin GroES
MSACCEISRAERSKMNVKPLQDKLIVKMDDQPDANAAGIIIPDIAKEPPIFGKVLAVGDGRITEKGKVIPMDIKVGDRVLFSKYAGTDMKIDGDDVVMMKQDDILGVVIEG